MTKAPLYTEIAKAPEGGIAQFLTTTDGTKIRFAIWKAGPASTKGTVVFLPGRTEYIEKYGKTYAALVARGFNVVSIDWRGQGLSDHIGGRTDLGDVVNFSDFQQDLNAVLDHSDVRALSGPRLLFSHSMGGCIALRHLLGKHDFKAAVFSAPMWNVIMPKGTRTLVGSLSKAARALGLGKLRVPSTNGNFYVLNADFENNQLTTDPEEWAFMRQHIQEHPALGLGGASLRWFRGALDEFAKFPQEKMPDIPVLVMLGSDESIVLPEAIHALIGNFANGKLEMFEAARHEIWMESPALQAQAWAKTDAFLDRLV